MTEDRDAMIDRVAQALRVLPEVDEGAKARLLVAVAAERERDREAARHPAPGSRRGWWVAGGGTLAAAALVGAIFLRAPGGDPAPGSASVSAPPAAAILAGTADDTPAPMPVQLVFQAPAARSVRVVGDFNGWDKEAAPMIRDPETGLWSTTLSLRPGRHVYAFVVDDSVWVRDPRAQAAPDADFGRPGSVLLVGRP